MVGTPLALSSLLACKQEVGRPSVLLQGRPSLLLQVRPAVRVPTDLVVGMVLCVAGMVLRNAGMGPPQRTGDPGRRDRDGTGSRRAR